MLDFGVVQVFSYRYQEDLLSCMHLDKGKALNRACLDAVQISHHKLQHHWIGTSHKYLLSFQR